LIDTKSNRFFAVIPARGSSKGIPRKNIREFLGKPLLAWTVEAARTSGVLERVILSTEDEEIAQIGKTYGAEVPFLRPKELAEDKTKTASVIQHTLQWHQDHTGWLPEFVVILEPTSPTRQPFHIREAAKLLIESGADSVASVSEVPHHYVSTKLLRLLSNRTLVGVDGSHPKDMVHRRQDLPKQYAFNGLVFSCRTSYLFKNLPTLWGEKVVGYLTEAKYAIDLDVPEDWGPAETRMRQILEEGIIK